MEKELIITRIFDAPRKLVWKAWTEPEMFKKWWGPKVFTAPTIKIDLQTGGKYLYCMRGPDGKDYWSTGVYREIVPMERIVVTDSFADEKGNVVPSTHYGVKGFPMELEVTVEFEEIDDNKTKMTLKYPGLDISDTDRRNMQQGWNESFDKLAEILK